MTAFTKQNLVKSGQYVYYSPSGRPYADDAKFVARFKYFTSVNIGPFMTFLRNNFTVEEWFKLIEEDELSPLPAAETKGFILQHIKQALKSAGFPITPEGKQAWIRKQMLTDARKVLAETN